MKSSTAGAMDQDRASQDEGQGVPSIRDRPELLFPDSAGSGAPAGSEAEAPAGFRRFC